MDNNEMEWRVGEDQTPEPEEEEFDDQTDKEAELLAEGKQAIAESGWPDDSELT